MFMFEIFLHDVGEDHLSTSLGRKGVAFVVRCIEISVSENGGKSRSRAGGELMILSEVLW